MTASAKVLPTGLKWLLISLVVANLVVAAAWLAKPRLVAAGVLAAPPPARVEVGSWPLPAIATATGPAESNAESGLAAAAAAPAAPPAPDPQLACVLAGPFNDAADADTLRTRIAATGGDARVAEETVAGEPDYLVYIEIASSRNLAQRTVQELKAQNIDAYMIPAGERENGVSVGVFTVRKWALAQRQRIAGLGYPVRMAELERHHAVYRVEARNVLPTALGDVPFEPCAAGVAEPPEAN